jgi:hypothetical protein
MNNQTRQSSPGGSRCAGLSQNTVSRSTVRASA